MHVPTHGVINAVQLMWKSYIHPTYTFHLCGLGNKLNYKGSK